MGSLWWLQNQWFQQLHSGSQTHLYFVDRGGCPIPRAFDRMQWFCLPGEEGACLCLGAEDLIHSAFQTHRWGRPASIEIVHPWTCLQPHICTPPLRKSKSLPWAQSYLASLWNSTDVWSAPTVRRTVVLSVVGFWKKLPCSQLLSKPNLVQGWAALTRALPCEWHSASSADLAQPSLLVSAACVLTLPRSVRHQSKSPHSFPIWGRVLWDNCPWSWTAHQLWLDFLCICKTANPRTVSRDSQSGHMRWTSSLYCCL